MNFFRTIYWLAYVSIACQAASILDGGRNDGEPDYEPGMSLKARDSGRNDGEPDYDPEGLEIRSEYKPRYVMFFPKDYEGRHMLILDIIEDRIFIFFLSSRKN